MGERPDMKEAEGSLSRLLITITRCLIPKSVKKRDKSPANWKGFESQVKEKFNGIEERCGKHDQGVQ